MIMIITIGCIVSFFDKQTNKETSPGLVRNKSSTLLPLRLNVEVTRNATETETLLHMPPSVQSEAASCYQLAQRVMRTSDWLVLVERLDPIFFFFFTFEVVVGRCAHMDM